MTSPSRGARIQAPAPAAGPLDNETHLLDRVSVLYKYQRAVLAVFVVVLAWQMVDSYTTIPMYRAQAQLLIEDDTMGLGTPTEMAQNVVVPDPEMYRNTQRRILSQRDLGRRVVQKLDLSRVPEFNGQGPKPTRLQEGISTVKHYLYWPVRAVFSTNETPVVVPAAAADESAREASYVNQFISRIKVEEVRGSQLMVVYFESSDPVFAAQAVNALVDEYVAQNLDHKVASLEKSLEWLVTEVGKQQQQVQDKERELANYRERQDAGALADNQNIVVMRLTQLSDAVTKVRNDRIQKQTIWEQVRQAGNNRDTLSVIVQNPQIQESKSRVAELQREQARLSERYLESHPEVIKNAAELQEAQRRYAEAVNKAAQNAKTDYEAALQQEQSLTRELDGQKNATTQLNRKGIDYAVLQREASTNQDIYNQLLQRERELRVVANSRSNNVRVVEHAEPPGGPFTPDHRSDWLYALLFGTVLAVGTAFGLDYLDDTVKTPEDITRRLKMRFLGLVPAIRGESHPLLSGPVPHDFGEAFRSLRTALVAQFAGDGPKIIAVTSAQPLEGKTTTATNMALALAIGGARVLLVDADMRRPSVHKALRAQNDRGLSQLLAGQARMREVVQRTHDPNLLLITAGRTPANPSELLGSERMRALIEGLEGGPFDWVIIDTPPILAVTDAAIIAPLVGSVVFVIGAEMTRLRLAERAVQTILSSSPRAIAAVLNKVDFNRNKYYYSRYYGHQYKNYYQEAPAA
jgi:capsular exopolysaccharide synthesis family protein